MKVALLGNMNNNNFSLMRYFRDLGVDAHLLLFANDGINSLEHFEPENDTFYIENWNPYIHQTNITNGYFNLPTPFHNIVVKLYNLRNILLKREFKLDKISIRELATTLQPFEYIVTSGYGAAVAIRAQRITTIFYPYTIGVEGINRMFAPSILNVTHRFLFEIARCLQIKALKKTQNIVISDIGDTKDKLVNLGLSFHSLPVPMVYIEGGSATQSNEDIISTVGELIENTEFSILMHSRLAWNDDICKENHLHSKNNHWVIISFKALLNAKPNLNAKLIILEYGPDVENTRNLIAELGLDDFVVWVPKTSRKNLMWLLQRVSVGVGEFIDSPNTIWGGTGWEVLASGKPLLQGFLFESEDFEEMMHYPEPPLLKVKSQDDVFNHLIDMASHPSKAREIGLASKEWFNKYNGANLAKKWIELLTNSQPT